MRPRNQRHYRSATAAAELWGRVLQRQFGVVATTARPGSWERVIDRLYPSASACHCAGKFPSMARA